MLSSNCAVCSSQKLRFIKEQEANGLLSSLGIRVPLTLKKLGRERAKPCLFVTFNIMISHIFPKSLKFFKSFRIYEDFLHQY